MKRLIIFMSMVFATATVLFGQQVRVTGQWAMQDGQRKVVSAAYDGQEVRHLGGLGVEVVFDNVGIGLTALGKYEETSPEIWQVDWDGRLFLSYHFRDRRALFDPFVQAGAGSTGFVVVDCTGPYEESDRVAVAVYPYLGAGAGLHLGGGFYASGQFNWRPDGAAIPCSGLEYPGVDEFEAVFAVGFAFN